MASLERELGTKLALRDRPLRLTNAGVHLLESAQEILAVFDREMSKWREACRDQPVRLLGFEFSSCLSDLMATIDDIPHTFCLSVGEESYFSELVKDKVDINLTFDISSVPVLRDKAVSLGLEVMGVGSVDGALLVRKGSRLSRGRQFLSRRDLVGQEIIVIGRGPFDDLSACASHLLGDDLHLRFKLKSIDGNFRNLYTMDFGEGIFFMTKHLIDEVESRRDDLTSYETLDGSPIAIPLALIFRRVTSNPNVGRLVQRISQLLSS